MTKESLIEKVDFVFQENIEKQIIVYALLSGDDIPRKLDIKNENLKDLLEVFSFGIKSSLREKDYSIISLSTADERKDCYYKYDIEENPAEIELLTSVIGNDNIPIFDFIVCNIKQIRALIIIISGGEKVITLFKKLTPVEKIIGQSSFLMHKANHRFEKFEDNLLRISPSFQILHIDNETIILDINLLEKFFGFVDVIKREATLGVNAIREMQLVSNIETLTELIDDIKFARKLTKIARYSPVIVKRIPNSTIINFTQTHPALKNKIQYNADKTQITLHTKVAKNLFIKLLNDDFLTSELTRSYYESLAKDDIIIEENTL